jgi:hypothetical protein
MGGVSFHPGSNRALVESQTFNRKVTPPFSFTHFLIVPPNQTALNILIDNQIAKLP